MPGVRDWLRGRRGVTAPATTMAERLAAGTRLVEAAAGRDTRRAAPGPSLRVGPDGMAEVDGRDLDGAVIASGLQGHGTFVVRGLFDRPMVDRLRPFLRPEVLQAVGDAVDDDTDAMVDTLADCYRRSGLLDAVAGYFGEPPVALGHRLVVRRTKASTAGLAWHQDGPFFGGRRHAVNVWVALDDCGADRPSLALVPRRVDGIVDENHDYLGPSEVLVAEVERLSAEVGIAEPTLRPGDAIILDEVTIHSTGVRDWAVPHRDIAITWFFAPSAFPTGVWDVPVAF